MSEAITRGARGTGITLVGQGLKLLIQTASIVVLSRLLLPADFGLVAMVMVFVAFGEFIRDFGMSTVGLQRQYLSQQQASNLFWLSTALGAGSAVLLITATPLITTFYDDQRLLAIVPALSPVLLIGGITTQLRVQIARNMKYLQLNIADVLSQIIAFSLATFAALAGLSYWSIVISTVSSSTVLLITYWFYSRWLPSRPKRELSSRVLMKDGAAFGFAQFLTYLSANVDRALIGNRWDAATVGIYDKGYQLFTLPVARLVGPLTQVVIPTVNHAIAEGRSMDSVLMKIQFGLGIITVWVFAILGSISEWLFPIVLGNQWTSTVEVFQVLAVGGMVSVYSTVNYWHTILSNLGRQLVIFNLVSKFLSIALIAVASLVSTQTVAWAVSLGLIITWPMALVWFSRSNDWPSMSYFKDGLRVLIPGLVAYGVGLVAISLLPLEGSMSALFTSAIVTLCLLVGIITPPGGFRRLKQLLYVTTRSTKLF